MLFRWGYISLLFLSLGVGFSFAQLQGKSANPAYQTTDPQFTNPNSPTNYTTTPESNTTPVSKTDAPELCEQGPNAHRNFAGVCVCDDGYTNIEGKCKKCGENGVCCGVETNTKIPFISKCLNNDKESAQEVFPTVMGGLTKILVTVILLFSFVVILVAGVMISASGGSDKLAGNGKKLIGNVIVGLALLGASGVILRLINPNFFK